MKREGDGWGSGYPILWQKCPKCGKKKAYYPAWLANGLESYFRCVSCKKHFQSSDLIKEMHNMDYKKKK